MHATLSHLVAHELVAESQRHAEQHQLTRKAALPTATPYALQRARVHASLLAVPRSDRKHRRAAA